VFSEDVIELISKFDKFTEVSYKKFLAIFLKKYKSNPTTDKLYHLMLNLPLGMFLSKSDFENLLINDKAPEYRDLLKILNNMKISIKEVNYDL